MLNTKWQKQTDLLDALTVSIGKINISLKKQKRKLQMYGKTYIMNQKLCQIEWRLEGKTNEYSKNINKKNETW